MFGPRSPKFSFRLGGRGLISPREMDSHSGALAPAYQGLLNPIMVSSNVVQLVAYLYIECQETILVLNWTQFSILLNVKSRILRSSSVFTSLQTTLTRSHSLEVSRSLPVIVTSDRKRLDECN